MMHAGMDVLPTVCVMEIRFDRGGFGLAEGTPAVRNEIARNRCRLHAQNAVDRNHQVNEFIDRIVARRFRQRGVVPFPFEFVENRVLTLFLPVNAPFRNTAPLRRTARSTSETASMDSSREMRFPGREIWRRSFVAMAERYILYPRIHLMTVSLLMISPCLMKHFACLPAN
ncbi:hypothetical protein AB4Y40_08895 [Paraburkholderia sp. EG287B]|uniref:hypothetical protein n=1 Tax=Paraburkholderia sp. EG287B TaxID=3237010 RepID=UPI0034D247C8